MYINIKFNIFLYSVIKCTFARLFLYILFGTPGIFVLNLNEQHYHNICKKPFKGKLEALDTPWSIWEGFYEKDEKYLHRYCVIIIKSV